jgi:hypothetical protein
MSSHLKIYNPIQSNHWFSELCPSFGILNTRKHDVSETGSVFYYLEFRTADRVLTPNNRGRLLRFVGHSSGLQHFRTQFSTLTFQQIIAILSHIMHNNSETCGGQLRIRVVKYSLFGCCEYLIKDTSAFMCVLISNCGLCY